MVQPDLADDPRMEELRRHLPALAQHTYLNTGTSGPLPRPVSEAMAAEAREELDEGRVGRGRFDHYMAVKAQTRDAQAAAMGVPAEEIALTTSTGDGMNIVAHGLSWQRGDEIVTTASEHESGLLPLAVLRQRYGVVIRFAAVGADDDSTVAAVAAQLSRRTRLLALSHVTYVTGTLLPLARLVALAHEHEALVLADGAQSFCSVKVDLHGTGVDFYAVSGQKWLCGPEGTGALYVRADALPFLAPTFIGYASVEARDAQGYHLPHAGARRFEAGTRYLPAIAGHGAALRWWLDEVGPAWAYARIHRLAARLMAGLREIAGVEVATPVGAHAGLVSFSVRGLEPGAVAERLARNHNIVGRSIPWTPLVRLSAGWYNTVAEIDRAVAAVAEIAMESGTG